MLPQFDPAVRLIDILRIEAKRLSCFINRQHRTRCKIDPNPDHLSRIDARLLDYRRNGVPQHFQVIIRMLQRPVMLEFNTGAWQLLVNNMMRIRSHMIRHFMAVR
ncbi:hypothetical protein D3C77_511540 [compost metagenome]